MFESHYKNAKNANLKIGVYWYSIRYCYTRHSYD
nr:MAG TPA: glycoside hydrolase family protein [Caudoviricetes sp.]